MNIKTDHSYDSLALHCLSNSSCAGMAKTAAQLNSGNAARRQLDGSVLSGRIIGHADYAQLDLRGRNQAAVLLCIGTGCNKNERRLQCHIAFSSLGRGHLKPPGK